MGKLYVAYGSNLNLAQMAIRCPTATIYASGILKNWEIIYRGEPTNSYATIRKKENSNIPVLIWDIQASDEEELDRYENFPILYTKETIEVESNGIKLEGMIYIMNQNEKPGKPSISYIETIHQGYKDNSFDLEYFEKTLIVNLNELNKLNKNK